MALTYEPLATATLVGANSTITFSSISSAYTDLRVVFTGQPSAGFGNANTILRFNGDTGTNYSVIRLSGRNSVANSSRFTTYNTILLDYGVKEGFPFLINIDIFSYAGSMYKTVLCNGASDNNTDVDGSISSNVGLWRNTSAINSITLTTNSTTFQTGTTATLYGILKA